MPAQEIQMQPQAQQMQLPTATETNNRISSEQPRAAEGMSAEPMKMRGGGEGEDVCCGLCAACACFECLNCCC